MFLPNELNELYDRFSDRAYEAGLLDKRTKELIAVACSVVADCAPCVEWHFRQAVQAGATPAEISEALAISMSVSAGSKRAKFGPLVSKLEHEKA